MQKDSDSSIVFILDCFVWLESVVAILLSREAASVVYLI